MGEPPGQQNLALTRALEGAQAQGSNESLITQSAAFRQGTNASTTTTSLMAGSARPAHHTGSVSWANSSDAINGGRGAQAHAQHHSQSLLQGTAAGGAAQGALASSVQAASTLAVGTEQAPAFSTHFATQRRHMRVPPFAHQRHCDGRTGVDRGHSQSAFASARRSSECFTDYTDARQRRDHRRGQEGPRRLRPSWGCAGAPDDGPEPDQRPPRRLPPRSRRGAAPGPGDRVPARGPHRTHRRRHTHRAGPRAHNRLGRD